MADFVLASRSPARATLLQQIGRAPDVVAPVHIDETPAAGEPPKAYALRMAQDKMRAAAAAHPGAWILVGDTVVACGRRILGATADLETARRHLGMLSGRSHRVWGAVRVRTPGGGETGRLVCTRVCFRRLDTSEIENYLASNEWKNRAGAYAIQGRAAIFVRRLSGSFENVVGLPLTEAEMVLRGLGMPLR